MSHQPSQQLSVKSTVSIVIPVYNEESQLTACLDAIARQTVAPLEVIVVDNNSTDHTAAIARRYSFVRIVREARQGVVFARTRGFNEARGEIIGRIDADTHIAPTWVAQIQELFTTTSVDAISGSIGFHDVPFPLFFRRLENAWRRFLVRHTARHNELFLYGANMAIRRTAWLGIRELLCNDTAFHEDVDLAAHLAHTPYNIAFENGLYAEVSARHLTGNWKIHLAYTFANSRTYAAHQLRSRVFMYPIEFFVVLFYLPFRLLYLSYNASTGRPSLRKLFRATRPHRVSPIKTTS